MYKDILDFINENNLEYIKERLQVEPNNWKLWYSLFLLDNNNYYDIKEIKNGLALNKALELADSEKNYLSLELAFYNEFLESVKLCNMFRSIDLNNIKRLEEELINSNLDDYYISLDFNDSIIEYLLFNKDNLDYYALCLSLAYIKTNNKELLLLINNIYNILNDNGFTDAEYRKLIINDEEICFESFKEYFIDILEGRKDDYHSLLKRVRYEESNLNNDNLIIINNILNNNLCFEDIEKLDFSIFKNVKISQRDNFILKIISCFENISLSNKGKYLDLFNELIKYSISKNDYYKYLKIIIIYLFNSGLKDECIEYIFLYNEYIEDFDVTFILTKLELNCSSDEELTHLYISIKEYNRYSKLMELGNEEQVELINSIVLKQEQNLKEYNNLKNKYKNNLKDIENINIDINNKNNYITNINEQIKKRYNKISVIIGIIGVIILIIYSIFFIINNQSFIYNHSQPESIYSCGLAGMYNAVFTLSVVTISYVLDVVHKIKKPVLPIIFFIIRFVMIYLILTVLLQMYYPRNMSDFTVIYSFLSPTISIYMLGKSIKKFFTKFKKELNLIAENKEYIKKNIDKINEINTENKEIYNELSLYIKDGELYESI